MPLTPSFVLSNNSGLSQNTFSLQDNSTGSDGTITTLKVTVYDVANNQIAGSPVSFAYTPAATYNVSILTQDLAANVRLDWLNGGGVSQVNTSQIFAFTGYLEWFFYGLLQQTSAQNRLLVDRNFFDDLSKLRVLIDSANQAINIGNSQFNSQAMLLLAQYMQTNANLFF